MVVHVQGALKIGGFGGSTVFGSSEASNFSTRSFVVLKNGLGTVILTGEGSGYTGGTQSTVEVTTNPFQLATATATLGATGALKEFTLTNRGSLYIAPTVTFFSGGGAADGDATNIRSSMVVLQSVTIITGGTGYTTISATVVLLNKTSSKQMLTIQTLLMQLYLL